MENLLNPKQHPRLFDKELFIHKAPGPSERSQVPHHRLFLGRNQGARTMTCSYCYQMGHMFNHYPFFDDKLM